MRLPRPIRHRAALGGILAIVTVTVLALLLGWSRLEVTDPPPATGGQGSSGSMDLPSEEPSPVLTPPPATPAADPSQRAGPPSTTRPNTPRSNAGKSPPDDLLKRRDPVPEGIRNQVDFFMGGGPECMSSPDQTTPQVYNVSTIEQIPSGTPICMRGFDPDQTLKLTIVDPAGRPTVVELPPTIDTPDFAHRYPRIPGMPLGTYHIVAEQGPRTATLDFTTRHATAPRLLVDRRHDAAPGDEIHLYVGSFPANRTVQLDLYGGHPPTYRTSFSIRVNEHGEGHAIIDTKPDDPTGCYGISHPLLYEDDSANDVFCIVHL